MKWYTVSKALDRSKILTVTVYPYQDVEKLSTNFKDAIKFWFNWMKWYKVSKALDRSKILTVTVYTYQDVENCQLIWRMQGWWSTHLKPYWLLLRRLLSVKYLNHFLKKPWIWRAIEIWTIIVKCLLITFLNSGITLAIFRRSGKIPVQRDWLMMCVNGGVVISSIFFKKQTDCPELFFESRFCIIFSHRTQVILNIIRKLLVITCRDPLTHPSAYFQPVWSSYFWLYIFVGLNPLCFYPRPVLAFGYCHRLRLWVCVCVCVSITSLSGR